MYNTYGGHYNITLSCVQKKVILIGFGSGSTFLIFSASLWLWLHLLLRPVKMELKLSITAPALQTNFNGNFLPESPAIDRPKVTSNGPIKLP